MIVFIIPYNPFYVNEDVLSGQQKSERRLVRSLFEVIYICCDV